VRSESLGLRSISNEENTLESTLSEDP
jgi:hypothetical protein